LKVCHQLAKLQARIQWQMAGLYTPQCNTADGDSGGDGGSGSSR